MSSRRPVALGTTAAAALLLLAAPTPSQALRSMSGPPSAGDPYAPLVALLSLLAWALAGWIAVTVAVTAAGHLPGAAGRVGAAVSRRLAPTAVRRAVEVTLGLSVAVGGFGASPALAAPGPAAPLPVANLSQAAPVEAPDAMPTLDWAEPRTEPSPEAAPPAPPSPPEPETAGPVVVVQPGDTLWDLAEQDLRSTGAAPTDADVARAWPSWWAANRAAVGEDPDLIQPGTHLSPPGHPHSPSS